LRRRSGKCRCAGLLCAPRAAQKCPGAHPFSPAAQDDADDASGSDSDGAAAAAATAAAEVAQARAFAAAVAAEGRGDGSAARVPRRTPRAADGLAAALRELDMDAYDDDDDDVAGGGAGDGGALRGVLGGAGPLGLAFHADPRDDPYLRPPGGAPRARDTDSDSDAGSASTSEADALRLRPEDLLLAVARNEDDASHLELWVYEEADARGGANLYVHHALMLPAFPLALAWLDCCPAAGKARGNFVAVGSFEPGIEIWDMDVLDAVEPAATLGGADYAAARAAAAASGGAAAAKKKKKKGGKKTTGGGGAPEVPVREGSHTDAVLGLAWNPEFRNVLASASADTTVKVWDVAAQRAQHTLAHHAGKAQAVAWCPAEASVLLSGGFDRRACLADVRAPSAAAAAWELAADVEALAWDPHCPTRFAVSLESGEVALFDARAGAGAPPALTLGAHAKACTAVAFCPAAEGLLLTASADKRVKLWGLEGGAAPRQLASEDLKVGAVFGAAFCGDAATLVAAGGAKGELRVWDAMSAPAAAEWAEARRAA
jgi:periodic tryptophan protein 1